MLAKHIAGKAQQPRPGGTLATEFSQRHVGSHEYILAQVFANGLTPRQLWSLVIGQTGLIGLTAGLLAIPVGTALALVLVYAINKRSFGWTLLFRLDGGLFAQALVVAIVAALLAGLYPAWKMSRTAPALALREE